MNKLDVPLDELISNTNRRVGGGGAARRPTRRQTNSNSRPTPYSRQGPRGGRAPRSSVVQQNTPFKNEGGYSHIKGGNIEDIANASDDQRVLKVSSASDCKKVAGSICYVTRAGGPPALLALGPTAINQAAKAVAIARGFLIEEDTYLYCQPEYRDVKHSSVCLHLLEVSNLRKGGRKAVELTAAKHTEPRSLAGAIAGKVREEQRFSITAIGGEAVNIAISAIAYAREYLADDELDIYCCPQLVNVAKNDTEEMTVMKIKVNWAAYGDDVSPV